MLPYDTVMSEDYAKFAAAFWATNRELDSVRLRMWEQSSLTLPQLRVLFELRRRPGQTTAELARRMGLTISTVSGLVIKLEDRELVRRSNDPDDRRREPLHLTDAGATLAGDIASEVSRPFLQAVAEQLGDDLVPVTRTLERLAVAAAVAREATLAGDAGDASETVVPSQAGAGSG